MKFLKIFISIILLVFIFDLIINLIIPESVKKKVGTSRNYALKSVKFHHKIAPNINVNEFWGKKKYKIKTNQLSMRIGENESFEVNKNKEYIGFLGDSFVYGSGIDYENHFISFLKNKKNDFLNLGYVSYSPSIYFKKIEHLINNENLNFSTIFLFIDHSDIQDEAEFYRENFKGDIVRKWIDDNEVIFKNRKYKIKNYLKQNSFIYKLYENISAPTISKNTDKCLNNEKNNNYKKYIDINRFGYGYVDKIKNQEWVNYGINKTIDYLDKIKALSVKNSFKIVIIYYPSALEVINNIKSIDTRHFNFLKKWTKENKIEFINTRDDFIKENNINDYLNNFIVCDVHWNKKGHKIISQNINNFLNR